jgi:hypothetical protein
VLAPHGSMCIELGDTYAGSGGDSLMIIEISDETVAWVKKAVEDFDPMAAPPDEHNIKNWACYAVRNAIEKAERPEREGGTSPTTKGATNG